MLQNPSALAVLRSSRSACSQSTCGCVRAASSKRGGSSNRYIQRQKNDVFVKQRLNVEPRSRKGDAVCSGDDILAVSSGVSYVSRSAFKLLQLDDKYKFLRAGRTMVDLGAAPGGWSQVIIERAARDRARGGRDQNDVTTPIFALDILPMANVDGVTCLQGDFLDPVIQEKLRQKVAKATSMGSTSEHTHGEDVFCGTKGYVDVVVSDMMANTSGNSIADTEASLALCQAAYEFATQTLRPTVKDRSTKSLPNAARTSVLVMKYFMSQEADHFRRHVLEKNFDFVKAEKMEASRKASREQFWVCIGFSPQ